MFSPDSRYLAYIAGASSKKSCLVQDGIVGPEWTASSFSTPVFSDQQVVRNGIAVSAALIP